MTKITVRPAGRLDSRQMAELLNEIIQVGGTTAYVTPFSSEMMQNKIEEAGSIWHVAEDEAGEILGFQWFVQDLSLSEDGVSIATFVKIGVTGLGIGSKLFVTTRQAAIRLGYQFIHAIIRADNESGLTYYQSRGFENYQRFKDQKLDDGTIVDKIWKRYDLRK
jgi:L-amino acid N-acyltransferase YncA